MAKAFKEVASRDQQSGCLGEADHQGATVRSRSCEQPNGAHPVIEPFPLFNVLAGIIRMMFMMYVRFPLSLRI